ncbi:MAG: putative Fe-S cluster assembly protein SufT [Gammaproteobacteria bacterium]|nr:putative Fe-S cluster assembly protein SufT [Gammaproteobacteria bacterium]
MNGGTFTVTNRDVDAVLIPAGTAITIPSGTRVQVTQTLGGSSTVVVGGNLARVDGKDADALGFDVSCESTEPEKKEVTGPVDEDELWRVLRTCYDPEIPVNIVDLGLVYGCRVIETDAGNRVEIEMTLTAPGCGMGRIIATDVWRKVKAIANVTEARVEVVFDPPWDRSMMSEEAKLLLDMF